jgi:hypothetical protein
MVAASGAMVVALCGCFPEDGPSTRDLPPTDELSTETSVTTTSATRSTTAEVSAGLTLAVAISTAPRVNNSDFHEAAPTENGRREDTSQFHFSTPDGAVNCSTVDRNVPTLACDQPADEAAPTSSATPEYCNWEAGYIVLTDTSIQGTCADTPWVWTRGSVLPFGSTISIRNFQCLSDFSGLYCLNTRSQNGFALRDGAYRSVSGADPAPAALIDGAEPTLTTSAR